MRQFLTGAGAALLVAAGGVAAAPSAAAAPDRRVQADAPHFSNGAGGNIAKTRFIRDSGASTSYETILRLYNCALKPEGAEQGWTTRYGCRVVKSNHIIVGVASGATETRYVPPTGEAGAADNDGWWIQCTQWSRDGAPAQRTPSIPRKGPLR